MADQIKPIDGIGEPAVPRVTSYSSAPGVQREPVAASQRRVQPVQLRAGAPADVVELSVDPRTLSALPPTVYLRFLVDSNGGRVVVQVINSATDEVIRQVPPEDLRKTLENLR